MLEKLLFTKIDFWIFALYLLLFPILAVLFAWYVLMQVEYPKYQDNVSEIALEIARFPTILRRIVMLDFDEHDVKTRYDLPGGFSYAELPSSKDRNYVLVSRYDGDIGYNVSDLYREGDRRPSFTWKFDQPDKFSYDIINPQFQQKVSADASSMRATHPYLGKDGNLTFHFRASALMQMDPCGKIVWSNNQFAFHHSLEVDHDGNFWAPGMGLRETAFVGMDKRFQDDHIVAVSPDGETLYSKSVFAILEENGLINRVGSCDNYDSDPIHLNDIQPVLDDGPHWKRGDVFISLHDANMVMLYRPATESLLWYSQDQMMHQHDVDILNNHEITLFDNRHTTRAYGEMTIGYSRLLKFDFDNQPSGKVTLSYPQSEAFARHMVSTLDQGLADLLPDGRVFIEETNGGRLLLLDSEGNATWQFINKDSKGETYTMNWSRYMPSSLGEPIAKKLMEPNCEIH